MTPDEERLQGYVQVWRGTVAETVALLRKLDDRDWSTPTDLPGWDVKAVAAHLAHLESELAGIAQAPVEVPALPHVRSPMSAHTERGPLARASWTPARIIDEFERAAALREQALAADPPTDPAAIPAITPGDIGWSWETLLSNRPLDVWMHQQDVRRAVGRPGGMDSPGAAHCVRVFTRSFGYSVGKRVAPPAGTTVVLDVSGAHPAHLALEVTPAGRAVPTATDPTAADVALALDTEALILLAGGRRPPESVPVGVTGDRELGARILAAMAVTP